MIILAFLLLVTAFVFWQKDFFFSQEKEATLQIAVVLPDNGLIQQSALREGMEQAAFNYNCELNFIAPLVANDVREQNELIKRQLETSPQGLILNPINIEKQKDELILTASKTIVYLVNSSVSDIYNSAAIGPNYEEMSKQLVERVLLDNPKLEEVYIYSSFEQNLTPEISRLLTADFNAKGIALIKEIRVSDLESEESNFHAITGAEVLDGKHVCITLDDGALQRLAVEINKEDIPVGDAPLYAWNAGTVGLDFLENGLVKVLVVDNQYSIGYVAVSRLAEHLRDIKMNAPPQINFAFIDKNNIDTVAHQHLLYPIVQ